MNFFKGGEKEGGGLAAHEERKKKSTANKSDLHSGFSTEGGKKGKGGGRVASSSPGQKRKGGKGEAGRE